MFKRKYLATNKEDETVDDKVVTVVVAVVDAAKLQSIFENVWKIISNDLAYIVCKENV